MADKHKTNTLVGIAWSATEKFGVKIISFISNIILARLLTPDDYGCVGMLMIFILLAMTIVEGGFASALIQKQDITKKDESTMFIWNIIISVLLYVILYFTSPLISDFYHIDRLCHILRIQGILLLVNSLGVVPITLLRKRLLFKKIAIINITSALLSVVISIYMAANGMGIWSLVWQQTLLYFFATLLSWYFCKWYPTLTFSISSLKKMFGYGSFLLLSNLLNSFCDNLQGIIIGKKFSASSMGFYSQAKKIEEVPTVSIAQVVTQVTFPIFAKIQDDKLKLHSSVRKYFKYMNYVNIPLMCLLILIAKPLFVIIFTEKWINSVSYFQILCVAGIINCGQSINYQVVASVGKSQQIFIWNIIKRLLGVVFIAIGMFWGIKGILWGMVAGSYFTYIVNALVAQNTTNYSLFDQIKDLIPIILCTLLSSIIAVNFLDIFTEHFLNFIITSFLFFIAYMILSFFICREYINPILTFVIKYRL